jgi:hypothetical protein
MSESMRWDGHTDLRSLEDGELREVATDARRREKQWFVRRRRRWWWSQVRYAADYELSYRVLAARPVGSQPTADQRLILGVLQPGPWTGGDLAEVVGLDQADCGAAVKDASERGWIRGAIGGIGGLHSRPQGMTELTPEGHQQLSEG